LNCSSYLPTTADVTSTGHVSPDERGRRFERPLRRVESTSRSVQSWGRLKALVVTLVVFLAAAAPGQADTQTSAIQRAATTHASSEKWSVSCQRSGVSLTCAFYDPSETGTLTVNGRQVESEGHVWFRAIATHVCDFDVLSKPGGDSTYQLEGQVNMCQPAWQQEVWPDGR
jgi:hypothetical protein